MPVEPQMHVRAQFERAYKRDDSFKKSRDTSSLDVIQNAGNLTARDLDQPIQFRVEIGHGDAQAETVQSVVFGILRQLHHNVGETWVNVMSGNGSLEEYQLDHDQQVIVRPNELSIRWVGKP